MNLGSLIPNTWRCVTAPDVLCPLPNGWMWTVDPQNEPHLIVDLQHLGGFHVITAGRVMITEVRP